MKDRELLISPGIMGGDGAAADTLRGEFDLKNMQLFCNEAQVDICFFGDSITNLMEPAAYYKQFGSCINRGISGDSIHIMNRRFEADVLQLKPRVCVILGGINNTWCLDPFVNEDGNVPDDKVNEVYDLVKNSYIEILKAAAAVGQKMVVCSVLPVREPVPFADMRNKVILGINEIIKNLCNEYHTPYADYHSRLVCDDKMTLREGLADDGLHPHFKGFVEMAAVLTPILQDILK